MMNESMTELSLSGRTFAAEDAARAERRRRFIQALEAEARASGRLTEELVAELGDEPALRALAS